MWDLRADLEVQVLAPHVPVGDAATGFNRQVGLAVLRKGRLDHAVRTRHRTGHIAMHRVLVRQQVVGQVVVDPGCIAGQCLPHGAHRGQHGVIDLHLLGRVFSQVAVGGNHTGHRVTLKTHLGGGQGVHLHGTQAINGGCYAVARGPLRQVVPGVDGHHARHVERSPHVHAENLRMGMGRAHETRVQGARDHDVVDVAPMAGQQAGVFLARLV
jgi:hypothetical protein